MDPSISRIKSMVEGYPGDRFLYLHRPILIVRCLAWDFADDFIHADVHFERVVIGDNWDIQQWEFGVRSDDINLTRLENKMLSGCQLRDTIVLDADLIESAKSINPASDKADIDAFVSQMHNLTTIKESHS